MLLEQIILVSFFWTFLLRGGLFRRILFPFRCRRRYRRLRDKRNQPGFQCRLLYCSWLSTEINNNTVHLAQPHERVVRHAFRQAKARIHWASVQRVLDFAAFGAHCCRRHTKMRCDVAQFHIRFRCRVMQEIDHPGSVNQSCRPAFRLAAFYRAASTTGDPLSPTASST